MARNRMIQKTFWDDEKLSEISKSARLVFIALWNLSDDYGVVKGHHTWLKNRIFPYDSDSLKEFKGWVDELEKYNIIIPFKADNNECYYYIKNFLKHQTISRPSEKRNPEPPQNIIENSMSPHEALNDEVEVEVEVKSFSERSTPFQLSEHLFILISENNPKHKKPDFQSWSKHIDLMIRIDKRDHLEIAEVIKWCQQDEFWHTNILSTSKLRKQYDQLVLKMKAPTKKKKKEPAPYNFPECQSCSQKSSSIKTGQKCPYCDKVVK